MTNEKWKMKPTTDSRLARQQRRSAVSNLATDGFVFDFAGFVDRNVGGSAVSDAAFFAVDSWSGQR
jgi:hypothetical protein